MTVRNIVRRCRSGRGVPASWYDEPFVSLQDEMNRLINTVLAGPGYLVAPRNLWNEASPAFAPRLDVRETDKEVTVTAELPGLDDKGVNVELQDNTLTIKGEKKEEHEEEEKSCCRVERRYGSFERTIALPAEVEAQKGKATFRKGVLKIVLPKAKPDAARKKTIEVETS